MSAEMIELVLDEAAERMDAAITHTRQEFSTVRTGRASSALFEKLTVEAYGVEMRLQELASFSVPEARLLLVTPHDMGNLDAIEKAIINANMGLNPSNDGRVIRLGFPPLTEERRRELAKVVRGMAEDGKQRINGVRRAARKDLDDLENDGGISSDDIQRAESRLDAIKDAHIALIEEAETQKEQELMAV
ncbi:MAG: ribosome recycling factor [Acidimicrobiales bacterium]